MDRSVPAGAAKLLDFIGDIEAPRGYETIYGNNQGKLPKPITAMSLDEIGRAQASWTKRFGSSATGRYQFMKATLAELRRELGLSGSAKLTPDLQDRLGYHLLKRRGYGAFMAGAIDQKEFGKRLAQEWASLPVLVATKGAQRQVKRGQSYYAGDGVNKSLVRPAEVEAVLTSLRGLGDRDLADAIEAPEIPATDDLKALSERIRAETQPANPAVQRAAEIATKQMVEDVQQALRDLGFPEVGRVDGKIGRPGSQTRGAISSYRAARGLPLSEAIDRELIDDLGAAMDEGWRRPIAEERATATLDDIADSDIQQRSEQALDNTDRADRHLSFMDKVLKFLGLGGSAAAGGYELINPDQTEERLGLVQRFTAFIYDNPLVLLPVGAVIVGVIYTSYARRRISKAAGRVEAVQRADLIGYREARHV